MVNATVGKNAIVDGFLIKMENVKILFTTKKAGSRKEGK